MRMTDAMLSMPYLLIGVALAGIIGPGVLNLVAVLAVLVGVLREGDPLRGVAREDAGLCGFSTNHRCSTVRILWKHIFPSIANTMIVLATLQLGITIIQAASLSFLGMVSHRLHRNGTDGG